VHGSLVIAVYVFLGFEGASVYARYARDRRDVGRATLLALAVVAVLFFLITLLPYGILPRAELQSLRNPSVGGVLAAVVGPWGAWFVGVALIVMIAGAFLSRSLLAAEVLRAAAAKGTIPAIFGTESGRSVPTPALWLSSGLVQVFLLLTLVAEEAYTAAYKLTSAMILVPYLLVAGYALKLALAERWSRAETTAAVLATLYACLLLGAAGPTLLLGATLVLAPATVLYVLARRQRGLAAFRPAEALLCIVVCAASVVAWARVARALLPG
jgi:arginine:ornithine antiporter / lysine permease